MEMQELSLEKFEEASEIVKKVTQETKLIYSEYFSERYGNKIYFKPENMQRTGAYKVRGAYYKISTLTQEQRERGLVTASAGNHAQGVAYAAQAAGVPATIVMPTTTPLVKVNNTKDYGAQVILHGEVFDDAALLAEVRERFPIAEAETTCITEDFSEYQRHAPGVFFFLGTGGIELHAPTFTFPEEILDKGEALLCGLV